jgi:hypothetical protein
LLDYIKLEDGFFNPMDVFIGYVAGLVSTVPALKLYALPALKLYALSALRLSKHL